MAHAPKRDALVIRYTIHFLPRVEKGGLFCENLRIRQLGKARNFGGTRIGLEDVIRVFEFEVVGQG